MSRAATWLCAAFCMALATAGRAEEYRLQPGDTLELSVAGIPDLRQKETIGLDGVVRLSLIGQAPAAGKTLNEVSSLVKDAMAAKLFRSRTVDGRENVAMISPEEVLLTVSSYRPVYVDGDVSKPGDQTFRPGMTTRQAISLAGGFDVMHFRLNNPFLESADFKADHDSLWTELARETARNSRLRAELANSDTIDEKSLRDTPAPKKIVAEIIANETSILGYRRADVESQRRNFASALRQADEQVALLDEQRKREEEGARADAAEYGKIQEIFQKGNTSMIRLADSRRVMLLSSTRLLQTTVQIAQAKKDKLELQRKSENFEQSYKIDVSNSLQDSNMKLQQIRARLDAASEKLMYVSVVKSQLARGGGAKPEIIVTRRVGGSAQRFTADDDFELMPGDLVDVSLRASVPGADAQR